MDAGEVGAADGGAEGVQERLEMRGCHCFEEGEDGGEAEGSNRLRMLSKGVLMLNERNAVSWVVKSVGVESV